MEQELEQRMLLEEWERTCIILSTMHAATRDYFTRLNYLLVIPATILSTVASSTNIGVGSSAQKNGNEACGAESNWISIATGIMGMLSVALYSIHRYMNVPESEKTHDYFADEYDKLRVEIRMQKIVDHSLSKTYLNLTEFTKACKRNLDILTDKSPTIPPFIEKKFKRDPISVAVINNILSS
jgi:hypothetical protein